MNQARLLNYTSYVAVFFSYVITGLIISTFPRVEEQFYASELLGRPLPGATLWLFAHASFPAAFFLELILGLLFFGLLIFLERGDAPRRAYLTGCVALALTLNLLQLILVFTALTMPMVNLTGPLQN